MFTQFVNYIQKNVGTTAVTLVTCPASNQLVVNQLSCANITNFSVTCSVTVTRSGVSVFIVNSATVPANGSLICAGDDQKIVLMAGDILQVQSSAASSIDAVVSGVLNDFNRTAVVPAPPTSPVATFAISPNVTSIIESGTVTYTVTTTNVPNGTTLYWDNFGTTTEADFTDGFNTGEFVVTGGTGSFTRTLVNDSNLDSSETIIIGVRLRPGFLGGGVLAVAATVTKVDPLARLDAGNSASYPGFGTNWFDISGNGRTGTLLNSVGYNTANGGSLTFNGSTQRVSVGASPVTGNSAWSWGAWIRPTSTGTPVFFGTEATGQAMVSFWDAATNRVRVGTFGADRLTSGTNINVNTWGYTLWTWDGTTLTSYTNGVADGTATGFSFNISSSVFSIGSANSIQFFGGNIAQVTVYPRAITAAEVTSAFNAFRSRYGL
jgi:hypothetical protein